eukprot:828772-Amphidinium_carterae.1
MRSLLADFGIEVGTLLRGAEQEGVEVFSDSSAARAFAQRKGLGRQTRPREVALGAGQGAFQRSYSGSRKHGSQRGRCLDEASGEHNDESPLDQHGL